MPSSRALLVFGAGAAALRVPLSPRMMGAVTDPAADGWSEKQKKDYMEATMNGVDAGGWDNDDFLAATKTAPQTSDADLLRQSVAYMRVLGEKNVQARPEALELIDELKAKLPADVVAQIEAEESAPLPPPPPAATYESVSVPASASPPPAAAQAQAPKIQAGVVSAGSYADMMGAVTLPAPVPPPPPAPAPSPPPVAATPAPPAVPANPGGLMMMGKAADILSKGSGAVAPAAAAPAAPPPRAAAAPAVSDEPLPDKDPRDLRLQYKMYLQTCARQNRAPEDKITGLMRRLVVENPPAEHEAEEVREIVVLERKVGVEIHSMVGGDEMTPDEIAQQTEELIGPDRIEYDNDENIGPRAKRVMEMLGNQPVSEPAAPPPAPPPTTPVAVPPPPAAVAPPPAAVAPPPAAVVPPPVATQDAGVVSGGSYADMIGSATVSPPPAVPAPVPVAPPPMPPMPPPVTTPPPMQGAMSAPGGASAAVDSAREALARLDSANDLSALSAADREALIGSLIRALAIVHTETAAAPAIAPAPPAPMFAAPPPAAAAVPLPPPPIATPPPAPVALPPPIAPPPPVATRPTSPGSSVQPLSRVQEVPTGSAYKVNGMETMNAAQYRAALQRKLEAMRSPGI
jgi:hypothetical protein